MIERPATDLDVPAVYRVCLATAGSPTDDPELLGHVYAGPYLRFEPRLARVVADDRGVAGYLLGCRDTRAFAERLERDWWPALRERYPLGSGTARDAGVIRMLHAPESAPPELLDSHPSHLHIDLLDRAQGAGRGRRLIGWLCAELAAAGSPGVHLGVWRGNEHAVGFYRHLGFVEHSLVGSTSWMVRDLA